MSKIIGGIQQLGVGVADAQEAFPWYKDHFGSDIKVFSEAAEAPLMTRYTGGEVQSRLATMALNLQGGGGFEIWQFTSRTSQPCPFDVQLGDLGLLVGRIKCHKAGKAFQDLKGMGVKMRSELVTTPSGESHFFVEDPYGNVYNIVEETAWFKSEGKELGGVAGAMIGCSDMERSMEFYKNVLGYDVVQYDETGVFEDLASLGGGDRCFRRVLLSSSTPTSGPFGGFLGPTRLELVQWLDGEGRKIFKDRFWGDLGFIHLCFDVQNMDEIKEACAALDCPFTVDSGAEDSFNMGDAAGRFSYVEDPDGALIEFVEAHKMPVVRKWGWYYNLKKRKDPTKPLPRWIINALRFSRSK